MLDLLEYRPKVNRRYDLEELLEYRSKTLQQRHTSMEHSVNEVRFGVCELERKSGDQASW